MLEGAHFSGGSICKGKKHRALFTESMCVGEGAGVSGEECKEPLSNLERFPPVLGALLGGKTSSKGPHSLQNSHKVETSVPSSFIRKTCSGGVS